MIKKGYASLLKYNSSRRTFMLNLTETPLLNGVWHEIFSFLFLSQINFPHGTEYPIESVEKFYEILWILYIKM
jgi:Ni,Fe-hydrogenase I cytochrome b subunit